MMVMDKKIVKTFYGTQEIPYLVCMVPIIHLYEKLASRFGSPEERKGWYRNFYGLTPQGREMMIVKTNLGNTVVDPILTMNQGDHFLFHFGYCGGLHSEMRLGCVTIATDSRFEDGEVIYTPKSHPILSQLPISEHVFLGRNVTVESILREDDVLRRSHDVASVDQETGHLYRESSNPALSLMVVSDLPFWKPFYQLKKSDFSNVEKGVEYAISLIIKLADILGTKND